MELSSQDPENDFYQPASYNKQMGSTWKQIFANVR